MKCEVIDAGDDAFFAGEDAAAFGGADDGFGVGDAEQRTLTPEAWLTCGLVRAQADEFFDDLVHVSGDEDFDARTPLAACSVAAVRSVEPGVLRRTIAMPSTGGRGVVGADDASRCGP